jgi:hypothetical protein
MTKDTYYDEEGIISHVEVYEYTTITVTR